MAASGNHYALADAVGSVGRALTLLGLVAYFASTLRSRFFRPRDPISFGLFFAGLMMLAAGGLLVAAVDLQLIPRWELWWLLSRWSMFAGVGFTAAAWHRAMPFMVEPR